MLMIKIMCRQLTPVNSHSAPHCVLETHKSRRNHKYQVDRWERARALCSSGSSHRHEHTCRASAYKRVTSPNHDRDVARRLVRYPPAHV